MNVFQRPISSKVTRSILRTLPITLSVISFIVSFVSAIFFEEYFSQINSLMLGFAVGFSFFCIQIYIDMARMNQRSKDIKNEIYSIMQKNRDFFFEGDGQSAMKTIEQRFTMCKSIQNIYIPYARRPNIFYDINDQQRIKNINDFLERPGIGKYTEVISLDSYLAQGRKYVSQIRDQQFRFDLRVTNKVFPFINFIIFEYEDDESEVFFGFGGYANLNTAPVFRTTDKNAVAMFTDIFSTLYDASGDPKVHGSLICRLENYIGFWVDKTVENSPEEFAIIQFHVMPVNDKPGADKRLMVRGFAFKKENGSVTLLRWFRSNSCEIRGQKIFVSHESFGLNNEFCETAHGQSVYDFSMYKDTKYMRGRIFAEDKISGSNSQSISTVSVKVSSCKARLIESAWDQESIDFKRIAESVDEELVRLNEIVKHV